MTETGSRFAYETIRRTAPAIAAPPSLFSISLLLFVLMLISIKITLDYARKTLHEYENY